MAFGFQRRPGTSRGYVNTSNTEGPYEIGQTISRRQYDKYVESLGKRTHLPGTAAIRETERHLEELRRALAREEIEADELFEIRGELERLRGQSNGPQARGQRRYNAALEAYVRQKRSQGIRIDKRQARSSAEFKTIMGDIKGRPNKRGNPNIRDQNRFLRKRALDKLGGSNIFREQYDSLYGPSDRGEFGHVRKDGRSHRIRRRIA